ncbi:adenylate/guanylate cyclase domain-containing protein [Oscillatoria sp. FACHB-1406]|uniref:adenylate/guanylate cyclase domain-containing protein n=1 Tax=Oscillatoria sp. FACHB-1406 TaxID=2692846 RepID=UPI0016874BA1|nr:adenylate/guanylate cyclase domain-containing protein [Oscillatoria sp. FACHB-1406]MBD2577981.1 HAMP domain-containing protein [Oscillatoria sp. FACHB-1406]
MSLELARRSVSTILGRVPLRVLLVLPFVVQIFGAVGLVGYLSFKSGQKAVNDVAMQLRGEATSRVQQHLQSYLDAPRLLAQHNARVAKLGDLNFEKIRASELYLWQQLQLYNSIYATYLGNSQGQFIYVKREEDGRYTAKSVEQAPERKIYPLDEKGQRIEWRGSEKYDPRTRPWYIKTVETKRTNWSDIYTFAGGELGITASEPFYDASGEFRGALGVDLILTSIGDFLKTIAISPHAQLLIVERSGGLVATSTGEHPFVQEPGSKDAKRINATDSQNPLTRATARYLQEEYGGFSKLSSRVQLDFPFEGERQYVQVMPYRDKYGLDWLIVVVVPERDFMGQIYANTRATIALCLVALAIATAVGLLTAHWLVTPIARLVEATRSLANGDLDKTVEEGNAREIKLLASSFNSMAAQLQESFYALEMANAELEERVRERTSALAVEQEKSERLLLNILPATIVERLKQSQSAHSKGSTARIAEHFEEVTILFADIVGFTPLSARLKPIELVNLLNDMFSIFDALAEHYGLEKIKTIGDAYMVAAGLPVPVPDRVEAIADMALDMLVAVARFNRERNENFQIRIGINTGSVVAGVIGTKKFIYDLWGDAVNVASRMESSGEPGAIQVTAATRDRLEGRFVLEERGIVNVKGKGAMKTYWLRERRLPPHKSALSSLSSASLRTEVDLHHK